MFAITQVTKQYQTYILSDLEAHAQVEIVPERGGILTRWRIQEQDILYLDEPRFANPELSIRGGIPILFPICGDLPDGSYSLDDGRSYQLPQHGFARNLPWTVTHESMQNAASLTLTLTSNEQTYAVYPFKFQIDFTYQLRGTSLTIQQQYTNRSSIPMPFSTGLHPYFQVADKNQLEFHIPATQFQRKGEETLNLFKGSFNFEEAEIDVAFKGVSSQTAVVQDRDRRLQITLDSAPLYSTLVFWTIQGKDYYCLEPWSAPRNAINTGEHLTQLEPGATLETSVTFSVDSL